MSLRSLEGEVRGSGVGKTERLMPLGGVPGVVIVSSITGPAALLSVSSREEATVIVTGADR